MKNFTVVSPWSGQQVATYPLADENQMNQVIVEAVQAFAGYRRSSRFCRSLLLQHIARGIESRRQDLVSMLINEAGKPWSLAHGEVTRAVHTFTIASEEVKRFGGELIPVDIEPMGRAYSPASSFWMPRGPALAIAPFNFPLNLIAHKVAPALAAGCSILVKPPLEAPGPATILAEIFAIAVLETSKTETVPLSTLQVIHCDNEVAALAVKDPRLTTLSFTGSDRVGWHLQSQAVRKNVILELGGNAAVIIHNDADLARAAARCAYGAFAYAGQICISVQRILIHEEVARDFTDLFLREITRLGVGNPQDKETLIGPLINVQALKRVLSWIEEAKSQGARVLCGGDPHGVILPPTVLTSVKPTAKIVCEEVFGPVAVLNTYRHIDEAIQHCNQSRYGLQAGVFTNSLALSQTLIQELEVGALLINEVPTYRADHLPYGGVKDSGLGREGVRAAMEHYSERRVVIPYSS